MGSPKSIRIGSQYKHWLVLEDLGFKRSGRFWLCLCTLCGVTRSAVRQYAMLKGTSSHCTACNPGRPPLNPQVEVGQQIGWWTVKKEVAGTKDKRGRNAHRQYLCVCRCGKESILRGTQLNRTGTRFSSLSCGCGRGYHAAVTMMLKHQNIMSPSVKAMFSEHLERSENGSDTRHESGTGSSQSSTSGVVSVAQDSRA